MFNMFRCWGFKVSTCKTLLKKTIVDAEKLIEKKNNEIKDIREQISKLFWTTLEHEAHLLISICVDLEKSVKVLQYVIYFAELVARHLFFIESERELDTEPELKEAVASLCFIASRYSAVRALIKLSSQFSIKYGEKYGNKFMANPACDADCRVNKQIPELLSIPTPPVEERNKLLKEIANEFSIDWEPYEYIYEFC